MPEISRMPCVVNIHQILCNMTILHGYMDFPTQSQCCGCIRGINHAISGYAVSQRHKEYGVPY